VGREGDRPARRDLRAAFPDQRGWSASNLQYMRGFTAAWPDLEISPQAVGKLPWGHVRALLDRLDTRQDGDWYAAQAVGQGWSRAVLEYQIGTGLHCRVGAAPSNFAEQLPPADSDLAQQLVRDPYVFDHLSLTGPVAERDLEQALMDRLQATVLEFGHGMAFVGRQARFDLDGDELVVDLLLVHVEQLRQVRDRRSWSGSRVIEVVRAGRTWSARQPSGRANSCTNRECRSTRVPTADGRRPITRSPSQCPGTARSSTSAGRSLMPTVSRSCPRPCGSRAARG